MITPQEWDRFFTKLAERGNVTDACLASGVGRSTVYEHIGQAEKVANPTPDAVAWLARYREAKEIANDRLESECYRRGHDGWEEPVVGRVGKDQDGIVTTVRRYSDGLLMFLLKAHRPEKFKDRVAQEVSGPGGGPVKTETRVIAVPAIPEDSPE